MKINIISNILCLHRWEYIDPIGVDSTGGFHRCKKCKNKQYIYWGLHYRILKWLGKIEE
jgi:hypothetical protein